MSGKRICRFWLSGYCRYKICRFSHNPNDNVDCHYWLQNRCNNEFCKYKHRPLIPKALTLITVPEETTDKIGLVILKYYLDAFLHLLGRKINKSLISLISEYCTDRNYTTARRFTADMMCKKCSRYDNQLSNCSGCSERVFGLASLLYPDNETGFIIVCKNYKCLHRLGITFEANVPTYAPIDDRFRSLTSELNIMPSYFATLSNKKNVQNLLKSEKGKHLITASFFGFKSFSGARVDITYGDGTFDCYCNSHHTSARLYSGYDSNSPDFGDLLAHEHDSDDGFYPNWR